MGIKSLRTFAKGGIWCFVTYPYIPKILGGFSFVVLGRIDEQDTMRFCSKTYPGRRKGRGRRHCACANRVVIPTKSVSFQSPGAQFLIIQQWRTLCSQALEWGQYTPFESETTPTLPQLWRGKNTKDDEVHFSDLFRTLPAWFTARARKAPQVAIPWAQP